MDNDQDRASKRLLFVHIGMPKTGSTSIQTLLVKWPNLLERAGVHVPVVGLTWLNGHSGLLKKHRHVADVRDPWAHRQLDPTALADLREEMTRCDARRFVISSELFGDGRPQSWEWAEAIAALGREADVDVEVFAYVRPQYQWLEAWYAQLVANGVETRPFDACLVEECLTSKVPASATHPRYAGLDYNHVFEPWREVFGSRLRVYTLDEALRGGGSVRHFLHLVGASHLADVVAGAPAANQRQGAKFVEVLRRTSAALDVAGLEVPTKSLLLRKVRGELPALLEDDTPFLPLTDVQIRAVIDRYADSNAKFAQDYGLDVAFHSENTRLDSPRPSRFEWGGEGDGNIGDDERDRVRSYVLDITGVDLNTGAVGDDAERAVRRLFALWLRLRPFAFAARDIRNPSDCVCYLRWLRWHLLGMLRRRLARRAQRDHL